MTRTPLRKALDPTSSLLDGVRDGLAAIERGHRRLLEDDIRADFADSLDLDAALVDSHPDQPRWDYLLGHEPSGRIIGIEPHAAQDHEVTRVIGKCTAARDQLRTHLLPGVRIAEWFWVASGRVEFQALEKSTLRLAKAGITFVGKSLRAKHLPRPPVPTTKAPRAPKRRTR